MENSKSGFKKSHDRTGGSKYSNDVPSGGSTECCGHRASAPPDRPVSVDEKLTGKMKSRMNARGRQG